jgi:hypothetical protein
MCSNDRYGSERGRIGRGSDSDSQDRRAQSLAESPPRLPRRRPLLRPDRRSRHPRRRRRRAHGLRWGGASDKRKTPQRNKSDFVHTVILPAHIDNP